MLKADIEFAAENLQNLATGGFPKGLEEWLYRRTPQRRNPLRLQQIQRNHASFNTRKGS